MAIKLQMSGMFLAYVEYVTATALCRLRVSCRPIGGQEKVVKDKFIITV